MRVRARDEVAHAPARGDDPFALVVRGMTGRGVRPETILIARSLIGHGYDDATIMRRGIDADDLAELRAALLQQGR
jgi:hypothetical protein